MTVERLSGLDCLPPMIVCHEEHRFIVAEQLRALDIDHGGIILEPWVRNTAPAICLATLLANENNLQNQLLILTADHYMGAPEKFCKTVINAQTAAEAGAIVTFGIELSESATNCGHIKTAENESRPHPTNRFIEKLCAQNVQQKLSSDRYSLNSGNALCSSATHFSKLEHFKLDIYSAYISASDHHSREGHFTHRDSLRFKACREEKINHALMGHKDMGVVNSLNRY